MYTCYLRSSFPQFMDPESHSMFVRYKRINSNDIPSSVISGVANPQIAKVLSNILRFEVKAKRLVIAPSNDIVVYVAKYTGPKIPKGSEVLPAGGSFEFFEVTIRKSFRFLCDFCDNPSNCFTCDNRLWLAGQKPGNLC